MKIKRHKRVQRYLSFYRRAFDLVPPFNVIIDGTFCAAALGNKVNIREQMPKYLGGDVKLFTSTCVLQELKLLGPNFAGFLHIASQFRSIKCCHAQEECSASVCLFSLVEADVSRHYIAATQDAALIERLNSKPGFPVVSIKHQGILLAKPSAASEAAALSAAGARLNFSGVQKERLHDLKLATFGRKAFKCSQQDNVNPFVRTVKTKGPNPLSCKKKQKMRKVLQSKSALSTDSLQTNKGRRRRRRPQVDGSRTSSGFCGAFRQNK